MTTEEELIDLHKKFEEREKRVKSEKRTTAIVFGILAIVAHIALVYAFFQQTAAVRARIEAERDKIVAEGQVAVMKKQILVEMGKSAACARSLAALQSSNAKQGK